MTRSAKRDGSVVDIEIAGKKYVFQGEDVTVVAVRDIASRKRRPMGAIVSAMRS